MLQPTKNHKDRYLFNKLFVKWRS